VAGCRSAATRDAASSRPPGWTAATAPCGAAPACTPVVINEVGRESGDGESWLFKGYVPGGAKSVEGYYSTHTNSGWLKRTTR
jgi:hypothetical protein